MTARDAVRFNIDYLVKSGVYANEAEVVEDGVRHLLRSHSDYRLAIAAKAYEDGAVSLGKAGEIAGLCMEDMKEALRSRGVQLRLGPRSKREAKREADSLRGALSGGDHRE